MDIDGIYKLLGQSNSFNADKFERLEELVNAQNTRVRAKIEETHDSLSDKIDGVTKRQDITNGKVCDNERVIKPIKWVSKNKSISIILFLTVFFSLDYIIDNYSIQQIWQFIKDLI